MMILAVPLAVLVLLNENVKNYEENIQLSRFRPIERKERPFNERETLSGL